MKPILFETMTEGTTPTTYGLGALSDCLACTVKEERNGAYELAMTYTANGIHAEDIQPNRFILAKPNYTDAPQIFRIYKVGKTMNGSFEVNAQHISYDLSGKIITTGSASSCAAACALLETKAGNFTINTDKTTSAAFSVSQPSSIRSWFGGKAGSLLDVYGGEWKYDNYTASLKQARGSDRGVEIRYGKNLTQLSQELDMSNLVTGIVPYYIDQNGNKTVGSKVSTGLVLDVSRDIAIDFSQDIDPESGTSIASQLATLANAYKNTNNLTNIINSITLDFVQSGELTERVDLCDTVRIFFEALGITASAKCVATTWDVLAERYTSTTFGDARTNIADTIARASQELQETPSTSFMASAIAHATELITGNLGGYVILHDSNGDGEPDEILIMNTPDITTATQVWRWNKSGLGYATSYAGTYGTAITSDGKIVANYIATGTLDASQITVQHLSASSIDTGILNADLIKAGTIEDAGHNSTINMTTGAATLNQLKAKTSLTLIDTSNVTRGSMEYTGVGGTAIYLRNPSGTVTASLQARATGSGGHLEILNNSSTTVGIFQAQNYGGGLNILNNSAKNAVGVITSSAGDGTVNVYNNNNSVTINLAGQSGVVTCVSVQQTSSRKVKKNIEELTSEEARKVLELEAVSFDYKNEDLGTNRRGFIAEDVAKVLPNVATKETEEHPASLDYIQIIPYLQKVIKDQDERIRKLEEKLNAGG